ncbi:MAG TPA: VWA domain-containing protein [bacterium]|nr:VWA domain-containing protein [bacterium]
MEFTWPVMLWGLFLLPVFVAWYVFGVRRVRGRAAQRFAEAPLFSQLAIRLPAVRRHIAMALYFVALALCLVAAARPVMAIPLPVDKAVVILLIDTSGSMQAPDVAPSRLEAAKAAAKTFVDNFPQGPRIGLMTFSTYPTLNVPPTPDHQAIKDAIDAIKPQEATAIGDGIAAAMKAIPGRTVPTEEPQPGPFGGSPFGQQPQPPVQPTPAPQPQPGETIDDVPAAIIMASDGGQNAGRADPLRMAILAKTEKVKIYTIGLGTPGGGVFQYQGQMVMVPFDPSLLQQIAAITDGKFFFTPTANDLRQIYRDLGRSIGWEKRKTEVSALMVGGAGVLMLGGGLVSMLWMGRLP